MKRLLAVAGTIAAIALLAVVMLALFSTSAHPAPVGPQPSPPVMQKGGGKVSWSPDHLVVTMAPGDTKTVQVTVSATVPATQAWVAPALAPYLTAQPPALPSMRSDSEGSLSLVFSVPTSTPYQAIDGTVHLRAGSSTVPRPLPVTLAIWPKASASGVTVNFPPNLLDHATAMGIKAVGPDESGGELTSQLVKLQFAALDHPLATTFGIFVHPNSQHLTLQQWFSLNIDPGSILASANAYHIEQLSDGRPVLILSGPIPAEYEDASLPFAYTTTLDTEWVIGISMSDVHELDLLGYPTIADQETLMKAILGTIDYSP